MEAAGDMKSLAGLLPEKSNLLQAKTTLVTHRYSLA